jgi:hypothetical protein
VGDANNRRRRGTIASASRRLGSEVRPMGRIGYLIGGY